MAKYKRYEGEFYSIGGVKWRVEIHQEATAPYETVGELRFEVDALTIEWPEAPKHQPVCGSSATLKIESPGDRTYVDLYTIEPASVLLKVYRDGSLYWQGTLDTEFYEEPYNRDSLYPVSLTFSDFGVLDRLEYTLEGQQSIKAIITDAMTRAGLTVDVDTYHVALKFSASEVLSLDGITVRSDNFTNEDGEKSSVREVLDSILQPLGLKMIQRGGKVYVYDLQGLYVTGAKAVNWEGVDRTLSVDKVYNSAKVTYSPNADPTQLSDEIDYVGEHDFSKVNVGNLVANYYSFYANGDNVTQGDISFTLFAYGKLGPACDIANYNANGGIAYIEPVLSGGSATACFLRGARMGRNHSGKNFGSIGRAKDVKILTMRRAYLPPLNTEDAKRFRLRLQLEMLLDPRYNPFEPEDDKNEKVNYGNVKTCSAWVFVPVYITLYNAEGVAVKHFSNRARWTRGASGTIFSLQYDCEWKDGPATYGACWLAYYDPDDLKENTGILGWKTNRPNIGRPERRTDLAFGIYDSFKQLTGEYIPYPPSGGYIEISVGQGTLGYDYNDNCPTDESNTQSYWDSANMWQHMRWHLYKAPKLSVVNYDVLLSEAEVEDKEYKTKFNAFAKDELTFDTKCGTLDRAFPHVRSSYFRADTGKQILTMYRVGATGHPEELLINAMRSQHARRHTSLRGQCTSDPGGIAVYSDDNQEDKKFMITAEVQRCVEDVSDVTLVELSTGLLPEQ